jgi:predicted phosphate transport protein (TIGR00153 family)
MAIFFRKQRHLEQLFERYVGCIERSNEIFVAAMHMFLEHGPGPGFRQAVDRCNRAEGDADHVLLEIERALYVQELLPDARGDLKIMLDALDDVPDQIKRALYRLALCGIELPAPFHAQVGEMVATSRDAVQQLCDLVRRLFQAPGEVRPIVAEVKRLEGLTDDITHALTENIYAAKELSLAEKMFHDAVVQEISALTNRAQDAAYQIDIIAIKRVL